MSEVLGDNEEIIALLGTRKTVEHNLGRAAYGHLTAWRRAGGPLSLEQLYWRIDSRWAGFTDADLDGSIPQRLIVQLRTASNGHESFRIVGLLGPADDDELAAIAATADQPVIHGHPTLGGLRLDPAVGTDFVGSADLAGDAVTVRIPATERRPDERAIATLATVVAAAAEHRRALLDEAARQILPGLVEHWSTDGEPPADAAEFISRLRVSEIGVDLHNDAGDGFHAWIEDGGWMGGHVIRLSSSLSGEFGTAKIMG